MLKPPSIITALSAITFTFAQSVQIKVVDNDNLQPIKGVYLYDNEGGIDSTDARGRATLHELKDDATLLFKHRSYKTQQIVFGALKKNKTVQLVPIEEPTGETVPQTTRFTENKDSIPNKVLVLKKKDFELYNPQTTADLLASSDEVYIQNTGQGSGCPMLRGFSANSLLYMVDGVRMNNAAYQSGTSAEFDFPRSERPRERGGDFRARLDALRQRRDGRRV